MYLELLNGNIIQDKSNSVHGLGGWPLLDVFLMTASSRYLVASFQWQ